ncbi:MAG: hypothetical protein PHP44_03040 [Kiritimatiellae bacterium]|nr:hypothetical protein [Kiritimatiellia bacterium]
MNALLEFNKVTIGPEEYDGGLTDVTFALHSGEVMLVLAEARHVNLPLFDAAQGLVLPELGNVLYDGTDWSVMPPDEQAVRRAGMGRIYGIQGAWVSNLDMDENITLRVRNRALLPDTAVYEEARALALELGLDELPGRRPPHYSREIRQISQCVRALLDEPKLLLAECALHSMHVEAQERFMRILHKRLEAGLALIWLTANERERELFENNAVCFRYEDGMLKETGSQV